MKISSEKAMQPECVLQNIGSRQKKNGKDENPVFSDRIVQILSMFYRPQGESLSSGQASADGTGEDGAPLLESTGLSEITRMTDLQALQTGLYSAEVQVTGPSMDAGLQGAGEQEAVSADIQQVDAGQDGAGLSGVGTSGGSLSDIRGGGMPGSPVPNVGLQKTEVQGAGSGPSLDTRNTGAQGSDPSPDTGLQNAGEQGAVPAGIQQAEGKQEDAGSQGAGERSTGISGNPLSNVRLQSAGVQGMESGPSPDTELQNAGAQETISAGIQQEEAQQEGAGSSDAGTQGAGVLGNPLSDIRLQSGGMSGSLAPDVGLHSAEVQETGAGTSSDAGLQDAVSTGIQQTEEKQEDAGSQGTGKQSIGISESPLSDIRLQSGGKAGGLVPNVGLHSVGVQETGPSPDAELQDAGIQEAGSSPDTGIHNAKAQEATPADARQEGGTGSAGIRTQGAGVPGGGDAGSVPWSDMEAASDPDFWQVRKEDSGGNSPGGVENLGLPASSVPATGLEKETVRQTSYLPMENWVGKEDLSVSMATASENSLEENVNRKMDGKTGQTENFLKGPEVRRTSFRPVIRNLEDIASRMSERVTMSRQENLSGLKVQLSPRELGQIEILVHMKDGLLSGTILVENMAAAEALEKQLPDLTSRLKEQNVRLQDVNISLQQKDAGYGREGGNPFYRDSRPVRRYFRKGIWKEEPIRPETVSVSSRNAYPGWNTGFSLDRLI